MEIFARKVSRNYTQPAFALKCDVRKFFDSINHTVLFELISRKVTDVRLLALLHKIIDSFHHSPGRGLPLGNVTSQLFANIYMNELDRFIKDTLKTKYYIRYCDDIVILHESDVLLSLFIEQISSFLLLKLLMELHPKKIEIRNLYQGVDFLGYLFLPFYRLLRTRTKQRVFKEIRRLKKGIALGTITEKYLNQSLQSYRGMLLHCKSRKITAYLDL